MKLMKYPYKLPLNVRRYCEFELRHYRQTKIKLAEEREDMMPMITTKWSETTGGTGTSKPTENTALRLATSVYILRAETTIKAIEVCLTRLPEQERKLIELYYFQNRFSVDGAGYEAGFSHTASYKIINAFLCSLALELGLITMG